MSRIRQYGVHRLYNNEGREEQLQIVQVIDGCYCSSFFIDEEKPFTEWIGGTAVLSYCDRIDFDLPLSCDEVLCSLMHLTRGDSLYVWHIDSYDWSNGMVHHLSRL